MSVRWVEISSDENEKARFETLSRSLSDIGFANEVVFQHCSIEAADCGDVLAQARNEFEQIRIGGDLAEKIPALCERLPSSLIQLRSADTIMKEHGEWWPRNFLVEGLQRSLVADLKTFDLSGGVFICGIGAQTRSIVSALARAGFSRFSLVALDPERGQSFVEELRRDYFNVAFDLVPRHMITQLPSTHSIAVNTLVKGRDEGALGELFYFNFLKPGGVWLDLPLDASNSELDEEAQAVGAVVEPGIRVGAMVDRLWAATCFGVEIDFEKYVAALSAAIGVRS